MVKGYIDSLSPLLAEKALFEMTNVHADKYQWHWDVVSDVQVFAYAVLPENGEPESSVLMEMEMCHTDWLTELMLDGLIK